MRLNKYIALCGVASRRSADKLIEDRKVTVNGKTVETMGPDIDVENDTVCINGVKISPHTDKVYIMLNKPAGIICSCADERGRKTVIDIVGNHGERLFPVGRLDIDTEGLLILTNDGDFAYRCTHPKHEINKKYFAIVRGQLDDITVRKLCSGIAIDGRRTSQAAIEIIDRAMERTKLHITIHEGRNRQVKKMFEQVGCRVEYLKRVSVGGLELGSLEKGKWRNMSEDDIRLLGVK